MKQKKGRISISSPWSLRRKLLLFVLAIFLPIFGATVASGFRERRREIEEAKNKAFLVTQGLAAQQEQIVTTTKTMLTMLADTREVQSLDAEACDKLFVELHNRYPFYSLIFAVTPDGNVFAASRPFPPGTNMSDRKYFQETIRTRDFSAGEYLIGK